MLHVEFFLKFTHDCKRHNEQFEVDINRLNRSYVKHLFKDHRYTLKEIQINLLHNQIDKLKISISTSFEFLEHRISLLFFIRLI